MNNCRQEEMIRAGLHVFGWLIFPEPVLNFGVGLPLNAAFVVHAMFIRAVKGKPVRPG
jgi:hypothetical protein